MGSMYLPEVESAEDDKFGEVIRKLESDGTPVPQILRLFAFKPERAEFLTGLAQNVLRGPSPLSPGLRELLAALVSRRNNCPY